MNTEANLGTSALNRSGGETDHQSSGEADPATESTRDTSVSMLPAPANDTPLVPITGRFLAVVRSPAIESEPAPATAACCVLPAGWSFSGDIEAGGDVTISGVMKGGILLRSAQSTLHVCEHGLMDGQATGGNVKVDGSFTGEIDASGALVEMGPKSRVCGSVKYSDIRMNGGRHELKNVQHVEAAAPGLNGGALHVECAARPRP